MSSLFLFGAGASASSGDCLPSPPPLGKDLFAALRAFGGVLDTVDEDLAQAFVDFEAGVAQFRSVREVDTSELLRDIARFFAQFEPGPKNLYRQLVRLLGETRHPAVLATINYDVLIELAVNGEGWKVAYSGLPVPGDNLPVLKLHGSCNFLPDLKPRQISGIGFDVSAGGSILDAPIVVATPDQVIEFCHREDSVAPAVALYAKGKQVLYCPSFVAAQQTAWRQEAMRTKRIIVVGVRVNPDDEHIWGVLKSSPARLFYVGPDKAPFGGWAKTAKRKNAFHLASSFEEAVPRLESVLTH